MNTDTINKKIHNIINEFVPKVINNYDEGLYQEGYLDSIILLDVVYKIEKEFQIELNSDDLTNENFSTINKIGETIIRLKAKSIK